MKRVYLVGPITGLSYGDCTDWREHAKRSLSHAGIIGVSPMRAKDYLQNETNVKDCYENVLSTERGITTRDRFDCSNCDLVFANFLGATRVSIGTCMEIAWADMRRTPIILVMEKEGNLHDHAMIRDCIGWRVETLEHGLEVAKAVLTYG